VHFAERETVRGALALGETVLTAMGYNEDEADMLAKRFLELDYENIQETYHLRGNIDALAENAEKARALLKETLETELDQRREAEG
jgi:hypothetical protein